MVKHGVGGGVKMGTEYGTRFILKSNISILNVRYQSVIIDTYCWTSVILACLNCMAGRNIFILYLHLAGIDRSLFTSWTSYLSN